MGTRVFISYARDNAREADYWRALLERASVEAWIDRYDMSAGNWRDLAHESIKAADAMLVLASQQSLSSANVAAEIEIAQALERPICWLALDQAALLRLVEDRDYPLHNPEDNVLSLGQMPQLLEFVRRVGSRLHVPPVRRWTAHESREGVVVLTPGDAGSVQVRHLGEPLPEEDQEGGIASADMGGLVITAAPGRLCVGRTDGKRHSVDVTYPIEGVVGVLTGRISGALSAIAQTKGGWCAVRLGRDGQTARLSSGDEPLRAAATAMEFELRVSESGVLRAGAHLFTVTGDDRTWVDVDAARDGARVLLVGLSQTTHQQYLHVTMMRGGGQSGGEIPLEQPCDSVRIVRTPAWGAREALVVLLRRGSSVDTREWPLSEVG